MTPIATAIWDMKYRFKAPDGTPIDTTVEDGWRRVAKHLASVEKDPQRWEKEFYSALEGFKFLPAGRILAGAGTDRSVTLFNCFVSGTIKDDMADIFAKVREAALTMQQGGGIGYDFSTIRPKGAPVKGVAADASGPLTFMDVFDTMCKTIMSAGSRRGAMMATMRCDHPDVEAFIEAKRDPLRLRNFNLSVLITDPFMAALEANSSWDLVFDGKVYKTLPARELWDKIMKSTYGYAEPGVIFIDRINTQNNLWYCETIAATNPCGEQPLPPYGACLLGSINLAALIKGTPFTAGAELDQRKLTQLVWIAVRMLDNVVDVSGFPLLEQLQEAKNKRRLGLGVTGLADALLMVGLRYGSEEAAKITGEWLQVIAEEAYLASAALAEEKGAFPLFDAEKFLKSGNMQGMPNHIHSAVRKSGLRNSHLTSIAPTGTISLYAGNVSSGIEPVFAYSHTRKVTQKDGTKTEEVVEDYAYRLWKELNDERIALPDYFVSAQTLTPKDHLLMQAAAQKWIDSSISKTINCPEDISFEAFKEIYEEAERLGCKGCTTYRPNDVTGSVLSVEPTPKPKPAGPVLTERPEATEGKTYKLKWPGTDHAIYITINDIDGQPFEIFVNSKNVEHFAWTVALTRMISAVFRRGGDISFVAEELKAVFDPRGGAWMNGKYVPSILAAIGGVIEEHLGVTSKVPATVAPSEGAPKHLCPACGSASVVKKEGCFTCNDCGDSKCG